MKHFIIFSLLSVFSFAQITGTVVDEAGNLLSGVLVEIPEKGIYTYSEESDLTDVDRIADAVSFVLDPLDSSGNDGELTAIADNSVYQGVSITDHSLSFILDHSSFYQLSIMDLSGKELWSQSSTLGSGEHSLTLQKYQPQSGVYLIRLKTQEHHEILQMIVNDDIVRYKKIAEKGKTLHTLSSNPSAQKMTSELVVRFSREGYETLEIEAREGTQDLGVVRLRSVFVDTRDGEKYRYVRIGEQLWMSDNLRYLPQIDEASAIGGEPRYWVQGIYYPEGESESQQVQNAKKSEVYEQYGVLYNWYAAMSGSSTSSANPSGIQGVCPEGWHLPSDSEWEELALYIVEHSDVDAYQYDAPTNENYTGSDDWAGIGYNLKTNIGWASEGHGNDLYGFAGVPSGFRNPSTMQLSNLGTYGYWWSSERSDSYYALFRDLGSYYDSFLRREYNVNAGFSVRCVVDLTPSVE
jgi:uncharacterized protein (TIGR02145 family)